MDDLTICVTTFMRPDCLENCLESIKKYYPTTKLLVADDSEGSEQLPFDVGLAYKRNWLLDQVDTQFIIFIDDDFVFTDQTKLELFRKILLDDDTIDLVGGKVRLTPQNKFMKYEGKLERYKRDLIYREGHKGLTKNGYKIYELLLNFFMARTDSLRKVRWDDDLKVAEHTDFFLRAKEKGLVCCHTEEVIIDHYKDNNERKEYDSYRYRTRKFLELFKRKHNIQNIIPFGEL
jgi:GT2 family glycosyltransferase